MALADHPPHGSGRAAFPHPALALGVDDQSRFGAMLCFRSPITRMFGSATTTLPPAQCPVHVALPTIPLGRPPSLHPLRTPLDERLVRGLLRYYATVRLPVSVRHRLTSLDFPMRPTITPWGEHRLSRLPRKVRPCMIGVSDRAEPAPYSPYHSARCSVAFRRLYTVGAPKSGHFRGSIPALHVPLSTLHLDGYPPLRRTRGQYGWLDLYCRGLAPLTPCRF
jgi:hypothetical protein